MKKIFLFIVLLFVVFSYVGENWFAQETPAPATPTPTPAPAPASPTPTPAPVPATPTPTPVPAPATPTPTPTPAPAPAEPTPTPPATETPASTPATSETPATPVTPESKPTFDSKKSFVRLGHPEVAARLGLTDAQRAEVQRLLVLRSQELAKAPENQWNTVIEQSEQKLAEILTPPQKILLPKVFSEKTIRINFKLQGWADVLQWFAEQAGLQLVMDAPPPGSFNYADQRDYTPSEAIDLLNSVLQTKGYTLIRNDKMLMLFDLKRGKIPIQFLPKLKPEELHERGTFEYTSVIFPLERRNRADVIQALEPFKGTFCQIVPMPGNSLIITDTAGTLLVLQKVIESVENPPPQPGAPPTPGSPPPPPPVWKTYKIEKNDPAKLESIFKEFVPTGKSIRIGNSREIHILVTEAEHAQIDAVFKMLEADSGAPNAELVLASYSLTPYLDATPAQFWRLGRMRRGLGTTAATMLQNPYDNSLTIGKEIINVLKTSFPAAVVSETPVANNIVVLTSQPEQEKIKAFFESLKQTPQPEDEPVAKLYKFTDKTKKMNAETLKQLQSVVPAGVFSLDDELGQILVVATAKEQEMLAKAVTELEAAAIPEADKIIVSYRLPVSSATRFSAMLKQLVTKKELENIAELRDTKQGFVTVWATAKQHELIQRLYDEVLGRKKSSDPKAAKSAEPVLGVYPMLRGYAYTAQLVLANMMTGADFSYDPRTNSVIAVATPDVQEIIKKAVEELDKNVNEDIAFIVLKKELPTDMLRQLTRIAPHCVIIQSRRNLQIIATGPKEELDKVKAVLTASETVSATKEEIIVHTLQTASPSAVLAVLNDVLPEVKATVNTANNQLIFQMSSDWKEPVTALLTQLDGATEFIPVKKSPSAQLLQSMKTIAPRATVIVDRENAQILVQGSVKDVENIKKIILQSETATPIAEEVYVHTFKQVYPYYVVAILREIYPEVKVSGYPSHNQLMVRFPLELKEKIVDLFNQMDGDIVFIPLKKELPNELRSSFATIAPYAVTIFDAKNSQLMIYGPKPDVEKIQKIVTASEAAAPVEEEVYVHTFKQALPYYAAAVVREIYPEVKMAGYPTANQLTLRFRPEMKEKIQKLLEEMDGDIVFLPLKKALTPELQTIFQRVAPHATVIADQQNALAMIYGSKPDVEKIQKIITTSETAKPIAEEVLVHNLKNVESSAIVPILKEIYPDAKVTDDAENGRLIIRIRPDQKTALTSLLAQLDAADPDKEKRYFKAYPVETGFYPVRRGREQFTTNLPIDYIQELQKLVPRAKIALDENSQQLIVWATDEEHKVIEAAVKTFSNDEKDKRYGRFQLRRSDPFTIMSIVRRMFPTVIPTYDYYGQSLIVEGHPRLLEKVTELIETLDPPEPSANDPVVRFYVLQSEPTPVLVQGLQRLVPTAMITPDKDAKQIMVIAKPNEQKIIETNVNAIVATFTAPEEPMLFIYPATQNQRERLEAFIKTAARDLKGVAVVPDKSPNQISVWAKPSEHQLIATILKQMDENKASEPLRQLKVFQMSIGDMTTAQEILKVSHPDATLFSDKQGNRLLVWATPEELEKVTQTLTVQGNLDNRQMLAYPIAGVKPETILKVIQDVFQGLKITPEPQSRRILVWATPEEHVKVAEIVEQANKQSEPDSELAEKFVAYSAANLDAKMITGLFKAMIPDADVYADSTAEKITVRARTREHVKIKELFEQLREKDAKYRPVLAVYPIGDTDPVMIETMLRSQLKNAESMSSDNLVMRLGYSYYYERMPWYRSYTRQTEKKTGYFKVDPQTQSAYVFVNGDDQKEVAEAIKQIVAVGNQEGAKLVVKRYSLDEMSFYDIYSLLYQIAPSARFEEIYTYTPGVDLRYSYSVSYRDFLAYARESEHEKIEALVKELNDRTGSSKKELLSVSINNGSRYSREQIIETIQKLYPDVSPMPGTTPDRILIWASKHKLERIQQIVDEACQPLAEGQETIVKSYPLQYISVDEATSWLKAICPNALFNPSQTTTPATPARQRVLRSGSENTKVLVVIATPLEHAEITKAISELDKDLPVTHKMVPRFYLVDDFPATVFSALYGSLVRAFPNAVFTPSAERQTIMSVALENEHQKIADFIKAYRDDVQRKKPLLEVYALKRQNYYRVYMLINRVAPSALIFPGSKPEQIAVWGTPKEHLDVSTALTKLETAANETENQNLKIYKVGAKKATTARQLLAYQFPGALIFEISPDEIIAWAGNADHESIAKMLETVAEAFPEPVLKTYYFKNVPIGEGFTILNNMFYGRAALTLRPSTGDILVHAPPEIQAKVAASIAEFDIPRPAETEAMPVAYDLSDIPATAITYTATSIRQALGTQVIVLPSSVPGQLIVWGKLADQQKVKAMVDQMLQERPETISSMQTYMIYRGTARSVEPILLRIVPNARFGYGINPNQLLAWAKESDHVKIKDAIDKLNETDPDVKIETYSLKNIYANTARTLVANLVTDQGLDLKAYYDYYGNQLIVQAKPESQKMIGELLEKLRTEDRELAVFALEVLDPLTVYMAINALFLDEPLITTPGVEIDQNTNMIFVQGTKAQLDKTRKMLIEMGEPIKPISEPSPSDQGTTGNDSETINSAGSGSLPNVRSQIRVIQLKGDASATIRELEKLWPQYQQNRLRVIRQEEPLIQKKEEEPAKPLPTTPTSWNQPTGFFSMNDPAEKSANDSANNSVNKSVNDSVKESANDSIKDSINNPAEKTEQSVTESDMKIFETPVTVPVAVPVTVPVETSSETSGIESLRRDISAKIQEDSPNVYVIMNEDGSLTVTSHDGDALDQLERIIKRIDDRIVFEGRDYTIYSVRNISASLVSMKLQLILRERLAGRQQRFSTTLGARFQPPRLEITPDESTNTIYVRGAKAERAEVANLIAMLDVSELPGERAVRKPFKVPIRNTQAFRVVQQVLNVYQQKMISIRLPGGVYPRVTVDNVTNSVEIIAPEPLATELKEYAEEIDRMTVEEPARKIHVIPLEVKSAVIQNVIRGIQQSSASTYFPYQQTSPQIPYMMR
ncbi:MAG: hypothetical protein LBP87_12440 [Planctomycetaceae bacterium]|jgi:hypothetical protein|nr:hypothetical protein [Planctomycetaceae bacterium]